MSCTVLEKGIVNSFEALIFLRMAHKHHHKCTIQSIKRRQYFNTLLIYVTVFMFYYSTYASVSCLIRTFRTKIKENHPFPHLRAATKPIKEATTTYTVVKCYKCTPISSHDNIFRCLQTYSLWRKPVSRLLL